MITNVPKTISGYEDALCENSVDQMLNKMCPFENAKTCSIVHLTDRIKVKKEIKIV